MVNRVGYLILGTYCTTKPLSTLNHMDEDEQTTDAQVDNNGSPSTTSNKASGASSPREPVIIEKKGTECRKEDEEVHVSEDEKVSAKARQRQERTKRWIENNVDEYKQKIQAYDDSKRSHSLEQQDEGTDEDDEHDVDHDELEQQEVGEERETKKIDGGDDDEEEEEQEEEEEKDEAREAMSPPPPPPPVLGVEKLNNKEEVNETSSNNFTNTDTPTNVEHEQSSSLSTEWVREQRRYHASLIKREKNYQNEDEKKREVEAVEEVEMEEEKVEVEEERELNEDDDTKLKVDDDEDDGDASFHSTSTKSSSEEDKDEIQQSANATESVSDVDSEDEGKGKGKDEDEDEDHQEKKELEDKNYATPRRRKQRRQSIMMINAQYKDKPKCEANHEMRASNKFDGGYKNGFNCDQCASGFPVKSERWYCDICSSDVCFECIPEQDVSSSDDSDDDSTSDNDSPKTNSEPQSRHRMSESLMTPKSSSQRRSSSSKKSLLRTSSSPNAHFLSGQKKLSAVSQFSSGTKKLRKSSFDARSYQSSSGYDSTGSMEDKEDKYQVRF